MRPELYDAYAYCMYGKLVRISHAQDIQELSQATSDATYLYLFTVRVLVTSRRTWEPIQYTVLRTGSNL